MEAAKADESWGEDFKAVDKSTHDRDGDDDDEEEVEMLKKEISSHPLYSLLIESHMECLKVGSHGIDTNTSTVNSKMIIEDSSGSKEYHSSSTELDEFMETYCFALMKLKEAMEKPTQETASFLQAMHEQLRQLSDPDDRRNSIEI